MLDEAAQCVNVDRYEDYGDPKIMFPDVATMARASGRPGLASITAEDVVVLMILMKCRRDGTRPKRDNPVDIAGYGAILHEVRDL